MSTLPTYPGVRARGNSIILDFTYQGERCRESIRVKPTKTALKEIYRKREAILYEIDMGTFEYSSHFPNSGRALRFSKNKGALITVEEALKDWLKRAEKRCQHSTIRDYNSAIYYHLIPSFGKLTLEEITTSHVHDWIESQSISNKRINNVLGPLKQALNDAYYDGLIKENPLARLRNLPQTFQEVTPFNLDQVKTILSQLTGQELNLIQFAFWSGLRTSELIALRWQDVDLLNKKAHIRKAIVRGKEKTTKTSSGIRTLNLTNEALDALKAQSKITQEHLHVFHDPTTNKP